MKVFLSSDKDGFDLKNYIKDVLNAETNYDVVDLTPAPANDFIESSEFIVKRLQEDGNSLGIAFDAYGAGSFMAISKHKGMVVAEISEERSAYMTREHNNSRAITLGSKIIGTELAKNISLEFLKASYDGGRHQIRVDMLNKLC